MNKKLKLWELDRVSEDEFKSQDKFPITVILDNIRSFNNVGSFFRTSDAFNVKKIILCGITPAPPHRDIQKTALGATESMEWIHMENTLDAVTSLQKLGAHVFAIEQAEETIQLQDIPRLAHDDFALVFGNEVDGVAQEVIDACDGVIEIPQFGTKHSLNVSVCAGIVIWEFAKKFI